MTTAHIPDPIVRSICAHHLCGHTQGHDPRCPSYEAPAPLPMLIHCPMCCARHIDEGEFATKPHHTHACQGCGHCWRPAVVPTVGVQFLPGFKNEVHPGANIKATLDHDAGAIARCSGCGRYSLNPRTLSRKESKCDCGRIGYWSGSFVPPTKESQWSALP